MSTSVDKLPCRVVVKRVLRGRYSKAEIASPGVVPPRTELMLGLSDSRPFDWTDRRSGIDEIETSDGATLRLASDGGQSVPKEGWVLLLRNGNADQGYGWTLYGIPPAA